MTSQALTSPTASVHTDQDEERLKSVVAQLLDEAESQGATQAQVAVTDEIAVGVDVRDRNLDTVEFHQSGALGITVYLGHQSGSASTSDTSPQGLHEAVGKALAIAKYTQPDECNGLAEERFMATEFPDLGVFDDGPIDIEAIKERVLVGEAAALDFDSRMMPSDGSSGSAASTCVVYGNSHGFLQAMRASRHSLRIEALAKDESGMQQDSWWTADHAVNALDDPKSVGERAAQRTLDRLGARPIATGKYPVLFDAHSSMMVYSNILSALSGGSLYRRASYLCDSLGTKVATPELSLVEHPHWFGGVASRNFDSEGVRTTDKAFILEGKVANYLLDSYSARRLGMETTGNAGGFLNLTVESPQSDVADLLTEMGDGLVVTRTMSQGANLVTGDFSSGAAGYWVEGGRRAYAVENLTVAANLKDLFSNMTGFGNDVETRTNLRCGSVLVDSMTVAAS